MTTDRKFLTFMYSYPNLIPLNAAQVTGIADRADAVPLQTASTATISIA